MNTFETGGEEYFIKFENGTHCIKQVNAEENTVVFTGNYQQCLDEKDRIREEKDVDFCPNCEIYKNCELSKQLYEEQKKLKA